MLGAEKQMSKLWRSINMELFGAKPLLTPPSENSQSKATSMILVRHYSDFPQLTSLIKVALAEHKHDAIHVYIWHSICSQARQVCLPLAPALPNLAAT